MLNLNSLHRRRERYCIIYLWKILEGLVPNFSDPIVCSFSNRRGRSCIMSHVNPGRQGTLAFNSFRWRSIRIFNRLPIHIRNISACSIDRFKSQLNRYLRTILDWRQCGNSLALCYFAVVMELPDSLWMNCKSEFGVIFLRCSST